MSMSTDDLFNMAELRLRKAQQQLRNSETTRHVLDRLTGKEGVYKITIDRTQVRITLGSDVVTVLRRRIDQSAFSSIPTITGNVEIIVAAENYNSPAVSLGNRTTEVMQVAKSIKGINQAMKITPGGTIVFDNPENELYFKMGSC